MMFFRVTVEYMDVYNEAYEMDIAIRAKSGEAALEEAIEYLPIGHRYVRGRYTTLMNGTRMGTPRKLGES